MNVMDILHQAQALGMMALGFIFVLTIIVFVHEFGHFIVGRWCGVTVTTFSLGFGPELIGFTDRKGTRWRISAVPLGGYVKFLGDATEAGGTDRAAIAELTPADRANTLAAKSVGQRAAIVAAGPIANFILAITIFSTMFAVFGQQETMSRVDEVAVGSAAERAGIQAGDLVVSIDGKPIATFGELQRVVTSSHGDELTLVVERANSSITLHAVPEMKPVTRFGMTSRVPILGITRKTTPDNIITQHYSVPQAIVAGAQKSWSVVTQTFDYVGGVFAGKDSPDQLGGPIRVAQVAGEVAGLGILPLIELAGLLSVSIGLVNLLPVPVLDGGHLLFFAFEAIRGRPLSERVQAVGFGIGFALVVMLMVFATGNDLLQVFRNVIG